jgi:hypothetical protein
VASRDANQRMALLETIVQRYLGISDLSMENLKQAAMETELQKTSFALADEGSYQPGQSIVEEQYTIQPIGNNVTRKPKRTSLNGKHQANNSFNRLFRRIFSLEFFHAHQRLVSKEYTCRRAHTLDRELLPSADHNSQHSRDALDSFKDFYRSEELQSPSIVSASISSLPPRSVADFLANCFFKYAEANYFVVEVEWFEAQLSIAYTDASTLGSTAAGTVCIIFAVLAIGTQYAYLEASAEHSQSNTTTEFAEPASFTEDAIGLMFYQQACRLLSEVIILSSLESIQACLLLGVYTLPIDASGLAYIYLNIGLKLGIQNGMHRKRTEKAPKQVGDTIKIRVWWTIYCLER